MIVGLRVECEFDLFVEGTDGRKFLLEYTRLNGAEISTTVDGLTIDTEPFLLRVIHGLIRFKDTDFVLKILEQDMFMLTQEEKKEMVNELVYL